MANKLEVEISGNVKKLEKAVKDANKNLKGFEGSVKATGEKVSAGTNKAAKGMQNLSKGAVSGGAAMTSFSRVIQDAPFGIMGVSNNITNLTETFGNLKKSTGSTKGALKAMLTDLKGFGGITLAISLATSAMVMFGDELFKTTEKANKLIDAQKDLIGSAKTEISTLNTLLSVARDENKSKEDRQKAINQINKQYGKYLPNIDLENVNSKKLTESVNTLNAALIRQAKIKGLQSRLSELYAEQYEIENKSIGEQASFVSKAVTGLSTLVGATATAKATSNQYTSGLKNQKEELDKNAKSIENLQTKINSLINEDISLGGVETSSIVDPDEKSPVKPLFTKLIEDYKEGLIDYSAFVTENPIEPLKGSVTLFNEESSRLKAAMAQFSMDTQAILNQGAISGLASFGQAIGTALANGTNVIEAAGASLLGSLGNILQQLGKQAIGLGIGLKAIKKALSTLNPVAAIGAGVALVALGSAFAAKSKSLGSSIGGGGSSASSGVAGGGSSTPRQGGSTVSGGTQGGGFGGTVVFEIAGTKLVGVLDNTLRQNRNTGGVLKIG